MAKNQYRKCVEIVTRNVKRALEVECVKYGNDKEGADVIKAMRDM